MGKEKNEEIEIVEGMEEVETVELEEVQTETQDISIVKSFGQLQKKTNTTREIYTTLTDQKKIFNLEDTCDYKINDCKGETMRIVDVLIKIIKKPLDKLEVDEETGEVIKEMETKMITILIDESGKSYVTASKMFTIKLLNYIQTFGIETIKNGLEIKIIEKPVKDSSNKSLSFELI